MKGKVKRIVSGMLSVMTILTSVVQPVTTYAAEPEPAAYEAEYPALEKVRDMLAEDEVVTAEDYEVEIGSDFDVETDFSGMEINEEKVKVTSMKQRMKPGRTLMETMRIPIKRSTCRTCQRQSFLSYCQEDHCKRAGY